MSGQKSYVDAMNIGDIMRGGTIGVVEETNNNDFKKGDVVNAMEAGNNSVLATVKVKKNSLRHRFST